MRIEAYNQVARLYRNEKQSRTQKTGGTTAARDEVTISQTGYDYQIAKQAVADSSDIREDKVAEVKARINSGNYQVDAGDFANKLIERYEKFSILQ